MTSHSPDYRSEYLRGRAKELLEYARTMKDPELRRDVEIIAESYERLADCVARREDTKDDGERQKPDAAKSSGQENNLSLSALVNEQSLPRRNSARRRMARCIAIFFRRSVFQTKMHRKVLVHA